MNRIAQGCFLVLLACTLMSGQNPAPKRKLCCHGCSSYSCSTKECGSSCKLGPKCHNCFKKKCT